MMKFFKNLNKTMSTKTIKLTDDAAKKLHKSSPEWKEILEENYGKDFFTPKKITDRVKSFDDACKIKGIEPESLFNKKDTKDEIAYKKIKVIAEVLNEGWTPDWSNSNQYKYTPYFKASGSGFSDCVYARWSTVTGVGSRLCYKSSELAIYAGKQFEDIYNDFLTL